jgi:tRNA pseudouridine13 synthase
VLDLATVSLAYAHGQPPVQGSIRTIPEDFQVREIPLLDPDGAGEHAWVKVQKRNATTITVAEQLARHAGIHPRNVSYAGLKDRNAVTEQWFSVHLPGADDPDWSALASDDLVILRHARHARKLQRGALRGNEFRLVVRNMAGDRAACETRLAIMSAAGVPNYFGEQRFGRNGSNLRTAERLFANPRLRLSRNQRSMALSSARSLLFNRVLSERIAMHCWDTPVAGDALQLEGSHSFFIAETVDEELLQRVRTLDVHPTGPLCGRGNVPVTGKCLAIEASVLAGFQDITRGLDAAGVRNDRRSLRLPIGSLDWQWLTDAELVLNFSLPPGSYATSVLRELVDTRA